MNKYKILALIALMAITSTSHAEDKEPSSKESEAEIKCLAHIKEDGVSELKKFTFSCDNYGKDATFTSKSGRFYISAFSEESCAAQLMIHDSKTNTFASAVADAKRGKGFEVFKEKVVMAQMVADMTKDDLFGAFEPKNSVVVGCSTNEELLEDILD